MHKTDENLVFSFRPNMKIFVVLFSLYYVFNSIESYKVLVYTPILGHSHVKFMGSIADTLAEAGHDVVKSQFNFFSIFLKFV